MKLCSDGSLVARLGAQLRRMDDHRHIFEGIERGRKQRIDVRCAELPLRKEGPAEHQQLAQRIPELARLGALRREPLDEQRPPILILLLTKADAQAKTYGVEAEGQRKLNEARNMLNSVRLVRAVKK